MKKFTVVMLALVMVLGATSVFAAGPPETSTLIVSADVVGNCRISAVTDVTFTGYDPTDPIPNDTGAGSFDFRCTKGVDYEYFIDDGGAGRAMSSLTTGDALSYELYTDTPGGTVFPSSATGTTTTAADNNVTTVNIFGRITALQNVGVAADYIQTVVITINY